MDDQQMSATGVVRPVKSKAKVECWPVCTQPSYLHATVLYGASRSNLSPTSLSDARVRGTLLRSVKL